MLNIKWIRRTLTAEFESDAHLGSGSGGGGVDALIARDREGRPVLWASHIEGVLRDAARRLRGDKEAEAFFGRAGGDEARGDRQRAVFTSLYAEAKPESRIWSATARQAFNNRAPQDDTLRMVEYLPKGTRLVGEVELPESELRTLERLVQEVDALGGGRANGAGRVKLSLTEIANKPRKWGATTGRLLLLLKNRDPLCITATATPGNLIPSFAFVPGRALLGSLASWLIAKGDRVTASLLTAGKVLVSDALPLPRHASPAKLDEVEVLPAPLTLQSEKPKGHAGDVPWWAKPVAQVERLDVWLHDQSNSKEKLKRPEDDLFVYRASPSDAWTSFRPALRVRLRNGRPDPKQADASLFATEQIAEETHFLAELQGSPEDLKRLAEKLAPVLEGQRWLRLGRGGAPVEVTQLAWCPPQAPAKATATPLLILTSDLLDRDEKLRWRTRLDVEALRNLVGFEDIDILKKELVEREQQDSVMVHGFNGTARLWRMPAAAIRRGSVFQLSGSGVTKLVERAARNEWLGERTHEGFGRFRIVDTLPGVTNQTSESRTHQPADEIAKADDGEDAVAATTKDWYDSHKSLTKTGSGGDRKPSLSQWHDLVADLERHDSSAISSRRELQTAGGRSWGHHDAEAILEKLDDNKLHPKQKALHARYFVRWLRAEMRKQEKEAR